jgi:predicted methyltransferase
VTCIAHIEGVRIGLGNQHPHRNMDDPAVQRARRRGERITRRVLGALARVCDLVIDGGDFNDILYPFSHPKQKIAHKRGLDYIRYIVSGN